ncbi:MAG TPA: hypothetical protein VFA11_04175 [Acidimicrobiales bacterium]|nr:hypothetical protein [Acidimicrobiales bacterium]
MKVIGRAGLELGDEMQIEITGLSGFGMYEKAAASDVLGQLSQPGKHVLEEPCAKAPALMVDMDT